jgi:hypothetical protein
MVDVLYTIFLVGILIFVVIACGGAIFLNYEKSKMKRESPQ